jgi:lactoylglutathione lyase
MQLVRKSEHPLAKFTNFFLAFPAHNKTLPTKAEVEAQKAGVSPMSDHQGLLELCWNWGTEHDEGFKYYSGNEDPKGFGHIAISVDDVQAACDRFEQKEVTFKKKPSEGSMKNIAFILDPDGIPPRELINDRLLD